MELFPNLIADIVDAGHEVYGHGMYHEPALSGRPLNEQRHKMRRMRDSIEAACGIRVQRSVVHITAWQTKTRRGLQRRWELPMWNRGFGPQILSSPMESGRGDGSAGAGARRTVPWGLDYTDRRPRTGLLLLRKRLA